MAEKLEIAEYLELIAAAQSGDEAAFERIYESAFEPVLRYIAMRVPQPDDAEDLAQQVFIRFYNNLSTWKYQGYSPLAYIFTVARSVVADYYRANKNRPIEASEEVLPLLQDMRAQPDEAAQSAQEVNRIMRSIRALPPMYAEVVSLRLIQELQTAEVAKIIGKSEVATRKLYSRGLQKLQLLLSEDNHE